MYRLTLRRWIEGRIGPKDVELLVRTKHLTQAQADAIKATERQVPWIEPIDELRGFALEDQTANT